MTQLCPTVWQDYKLSKARHKEGEALYSAPNRPHLHTYWVTYTTAPFWWTLTGPFWKRDCWLVWKDDGKLQFIIITTVTIYWNKIIEKSIICTCTACSFCYFNLWCLTPSPQLLFLCDFFFKYNLPLSLFQSTKSGCTANWSYCLPFICWPSNVWSKCRAMLIVIDLFATKLTPLHLGIMFHLSIRGVKLWCEKTAGCFETQMWNADSLKIKEDCLFYVLFMKLDPVVNTAYGVWVFGMLSTCSLSGVPPRVLQCSIGLHYWGLCVNIMCI